MNRYEDIINLERPLLKHPRMSIEKRASIFSPFAALSGFDNMIKEVEIDKIEKITLSDDEKKNLDQIIQEINNDLNRVVIIIYYINNNYQKIEGFIKKVDVINRLIILENNDKIPFDDIIDIDIKNNLE